MECIFIINYRIGRSSSIIFLHGLKIDLHCQSSFISCMGRTKLHVNYCSMELKKHVNYCLMELKKRKEMSSIKLNRSSSIWKEMNKIRFNRKNMTLTMQNIMKGSIRSILISAMADLARLVGTNLSTILTQLFNSYKFQ